MKRILVACLVILTIILIAFLTNHYWVHRYDDLINRQAGIYQLDPDLIWSVIYEETYFRPWQNGRDGEIGLMQVTPAVGREWATETGMRNLEREMNSNPARLLRDPERNIQIGCWYLERFYERYRDLPEAEPRMIAAYNAGLSRAEEWNNPANSDSPLSADEFINRIDIPSTRAYVISVMDRFRKLKAARGVSGDQSSTANH